MKKGETLYARERMSSKGFSLNYNGEEVIVVSEEKIPDDIPMKFADNYQQYKRKWAYRRR